MGVRLSQSNFFLATEVSGRLGREALRHFVLTFDYRNGLAKFSQP